MSELNPIEILEKVDLFYNNAWNKLIIFTTIILTIVGVVIPLIINWWQNRNLKIREKSLQDELKKFFDKELNKVKEEISDSIEKLFDEKLEKSLASQEEIKNSMQGSFFHLQANTESKNMVEKMKSLTWAATCYIKGKDYLNLGGVLEMIEEGLKKIHNEDIIEMDIEDAKISDLLEDLEKINDDSVYTIFIRNFKKEFEKAKNREKAPTLKFDDDTK